MDDTQKEFLQKWVKDIIIESSPRAALEAQLERHVNIGNAVMSELAESGNTSAIFDWLTQTRWNEIKKEFEGKIEKSSKVIDYSKFFELVIAEALEVSDLKLNGRIQFSAEISQLEPGVFMVQSKTSRRTTPKKEKKDVAFDSKASIFDEKYRVVEIQRIEGDLGYHNVDTKMSVAEWIKANIERSEMFIDPPALSHDIAISDLQPSNPFGRVAWSLIRRPFGVSDDCTTVAIEVRDENNNCVVAFSMCETTAGGVIVSVAGMPQRSFFPGAPECLSNEEKIAFHSQLFKELQSSSKDSKVPLVTTGTRT